MSGTKYMLVFAVLILSLIRVMPVYADGRQPADRVILISVGGLNYENYASSNLPNLKQLAYEGVATDKTLAVKADNRNLRRFLCSPAPCRRSINISLPMIK
jgi:hypothetical protein